MLLSVIMVLGVVVFVWIFFQYLKSNYDAYQLEAHIRSFEDRNQNLTDEIQAQQEDYLYYTSEAYLEKYAKSALGMKNPGEEVIVIEDAPVVEQLAEKDENELSTREFALLPNERKWYIYFFGDPVVVARNMLPEVNESE